jgi:hypothetical protein
MIVTVVYAPFCIYEKLYQLETNRKGKVRVAYYNSMTDSVTIVQDFSRQFSK